MLFTKFCFAKSWLQYLLLSGCPSEDLAGSLLLNFRTLVILQVQVL